MTEPLDHRRARIAHAHVVAARSEDGGAAYRAVVLALPALVQREGLAVALHAVAARGEGRILDHLSEQLDQPDRAALLAWVRGLDARGTRQATAEIRRCLGWYGRFARIELREGA